MGGGGDQKSGLVQTFAEIRKLNRIKDFQDDTVRRTIVLRV